MKLENAQAAMQIILHAGDARLKTAEANRTGIFGRVFCQKF